MEQILTTKNIIIYFIIINILGFLIMFIDKQKAKKGKWRIPEKTIFIVTALGGDDAKFTEEVEKLGYKVLGIEHQPYEKKGLFHRK